MSVKISDRPDLANRVTADERAAGRRAPYHVYYRLGGKLMLDASYATDPDEAVASTARLVKMAFPKKFKAGFEAAFVVMTNPCVTP